MMTKINVLDYGYVRLVDSMGGDLSVVRAARVSYNAAWRTGDDTGADTKLINFLWKNKHTTPFEACVITFEVLAPIFVLRQWHRHRTQSYNELSARYRELPETFYVPERDIIGKQATTNKQGRELGRTVSDEEMAAYKAMCEAGFETYRALLAADWPRELARAVLPLSTYSHMFTTMNLLNLFRFLTLRCDTHAQYEIRMYANAMAKLAVEVAPVCVSAWVKNSQHN